MKYRCGVRLCIVLSLLAVFAFERPLTSSAANDQLIYLTTVQISTVAAPANQSSYATGQVVVEVDPASGANIADINAAYGTATLAALTPGSNIYLLDTPGDEDPQKTAQQMDTDLRLLFAEPNFIGRAPEADPSSIKSWGGANAAPLNTQYALGMIDLAHAQTISRGKGAVVAVIDTGAQLNHPALTGNFTAARYDFVDGDNVPDDLFNDQDDDGDGQVDEGAGHGTHVAGIIHLIAPEAQVMPLRALDSDGNGEFFDVARAIQYAASNGANVINLSLGTSSRSDLLRTVIRSATLAGVTVIAAAGNLNSATEQYPAADQCVIGVTAVGSSDVKSSFANYGNWIDIAAPGESIYSAFPPSGYAWWSGTSMATPFIAGQSALVYAVQPTYNARDMARLIGGTARSLDAQNPDFQGQLGGGQTDLGASLDAAASGNLPNSGKGYISGSCVE